MIVRSLKSSLTPTPTMDATLNSGLCNKWVNTRLHPVSKPRVRHHAAEVNLSITDKETSLP